MTATTVGKLRPREPVPRMPKIDDRAARRNTCLLRLGLGDVRDHVRPSRIRSRSRPATSRRNGPRMVAAISTTGMDKPILNFFSFQSARYAVKRDRWKMSRSRSTTIRSTSTTSTRMLDAMKKSLAHFSAAYSPYQFRQLRILEFPDYERLAPELCQHRAVLRIHRLHCRPARPERYRLRLLRHRARNRPPVVGAPGDRRQRAGRDDARRNLCPVFRADGAGTRVRSPPRCANSSSTSSTAI